MTDNQLIASLRSGWLQELFDDLTTGGNKPNYSLDGQSVDRATWRDGMWKRIADSTKLLTIDEPYELRGNAV